jgi:hypothetical protein
MAASALSLATWPSPQRCPLTKHTQGRPVGHLFIITQHLYMRIQMLALLHSQNNGKNHGDNAIKRFGVRGAPS